jgi:hypothetical protein
LDKFPDVDRRHGASGFAHFTGAAHRLASNALSPSRNARRRADVTVKQ